MKIKAPLVRLTGWDAHNTVTDIHEGDFGRWALYRRVHEILASRGTVRVSIEFPKKER